MPIYDFLPFSQLVAVVNAVIFVALQVASDQLVGAAGPAPSHVPEEGAPGAGTRRSIEILLVEDNPADVRFFSEALYFARIRHQLSVVTNGEEALAGRRRS